MTAAVAAKFTHRETTDAATERSTRRTIFWLLVASVNFPDLDVVMAFLGDPIFSIKTHRWITHSIFAAPLWALFPAAVFFRFSKLKNFKLLWLAALGGIYLHIVCDLVTPYGTMLLAPFSNHRFTLSSQFIVDLYFTGGLVVFLLLGRFDSKRQKIWRNAGLGFALSFMLLAFCIHEYAEHKIHRAAQESKIEFTKISALPQPLSVFEWAGMVQTASGVQKTYFSVFDKALTFENNLHANGPLVERAKQNADVQWYIKFAHHPLIFSYQQNDTSIVEVHDLQFSAPPKLVKSWNLKQRRPPFTLRLTYDAAGVLLKTTFNE